MGLKRTTGALLAMVLAMAMPAVASADTLPPGDDDRTFATSQGGWTSASRTAGACADLLLCPTVANGHMTGGGAGGVSDGYIRTQFVGILSVATGSSIGEWTGPAFTYTGNEGKQPASVSLDLSIRPDISALLGLDLSNQSTYRVDLVDQSSTVLNVIPTTPLTSSTEWTAVPTASINPAQLTIGNSYQLRITTTYTTTLALLAAGDVGYDDVRLTTTGFAPDDDGPGGPGDDGDDGKDGDDGRRGTDGKDATGPAGVDGVNGGSGVTSAAQLRGLTRTVVLPRKVRMTKRAVRVKVRCPRAADPLACRIKTRGLVKGKHSGPATKAKVVRVKPGKARSVRLRIKKRHVERYADKRRVMLKSRVKVGDVKVVVTKRVKVRR